MTLQEYLDKQDLTQQALADVLGVTQQMVSYYLKKGVSDYSTMLQIEKATGGKVKPKDWVWGN